MDTALRPALVVVGVAAGIALRIWIIRTPELGYVDSDEAVPGLMARHFLNGEFSAFYWGQTYGGTAEVALIAAVFLIVGSHAIVLRLVPMVLYAIGALLVWRIGRRTIGEPGATVAGLLVWLWPAYFVWRSTREYGYYGVLLVCGLTVVLLALRLRERPSLLDATGFGIALGVGWWCSPQIVLVALPVLAWMAWRCRRVVRYLPALVVGAAVGASPWIVANVRSGWASLTFTPGYTAIEPFRSRLQGIFEDGLPEVVGLRVPMTQQWFPTGTRAPRFLAAACGAPRNRGSVARIARARRSDCGLITVSRSPLEIHDVSPRTALPRVPRAGCRSPLRGAPHRPPSGGYRRRSRDSLVGCRTRAALGCWRIHSRRCADDGRAGHPRARSARSDTRPGGLLGCIPDHVPDS